MRPKDQKLNADLFGRRLGFQPADRIAEERGARQQMGEMAASNLAGELKGEPLPKSGKTQLKLRAIGCVSESVTREDNVVLTWKDGVAAFGWLGLFHAVGIFVLAASVVVGHGVTCCWEPLGWILSGMRSVT